MKSSVLNIRLIMMNTLIQWVSVLLLLVLVACTRDPNAGNTMETENSVAITVHNFEAQNAANVQVSIRPMWFLADTSGKLTNNDTIRTSIIDAKGQVQFTDLPAGKYRIWVLQDSLGSMQELTIAENSKEQKKVDISLEKTGRLEGVIELPDSLSYAWVQIYGLDLIVKTDSLGRFIFENLPTGVHQMIAWSPNSSTAFIDDLVQIDAGEILQIDQFSPPSVGTENVSTWRYAKQLNLGDLISDWMRPLKVPAVLTLRLNEESFDFSEALSDGTDLRLFDASGRRIEFDRAYWNSDSKYGVLKIPLKSLKDTASEITMRWGRKGAIDLGRVAVWNDISRANYLALNSVLLSDFESKNSIASWYTRQSDSAIVIPSPESDFWAAVDSAGLGRPGNAPHIQFSAAVGKWVLLGTGFDAGTVNMGALDSIELWARGEGTMSIALDNLNKLPGEKAWTHKTLDSVWTRIAITPKDFIVGSSVGGNVGWEKVRDNITNFTLLFSNGGSVWIDDVRIYGINKDDLQ